MNRQIGIGLIVVVALFVAGAYLYLNRTNPAVESGEKTSFPELGEEDAQTVKNTSVQTDSEENREDESNTQREVDKETEKPFKPVAEAYPDVFAEIQENGRARVIVMLIGNEHTDPYSKDQEKKKEESQKIIERVLATLTEQDFEVTAKFTYFPSFGGDLTLSGLRKLESNSEVENITLDFAIPPAQ